MQHHQIASISRATALVACIAALMCALAGSAAAKPQQLSERGGQQAEQPALTNPRVGDTPSDRVSPTAAPTSESSTTSSDDGSDNAPLIVGLSLLTVALLGSGTYVVRRRRHLAPGH